LSNSGAELPEQEKQRFQTLTSQLRRASRHQTNYFEQ
jgi:hypothetical protein